jgi:photosystem II stability/assembly factor-like uncharacterized protein
MQAAELETDFDEGMPRARAGRAVALIAVSILAITVTGTLYLHPTFGPQPGPAQSAPSTLRGDYRVTAVDFVSAETGWLVVLFTSGDFAVIHTTDGGTTWTRQLTAPAQSHAVYARFFDDLSGVVALDGGRPVLSRTTDGGMSWSTLPALTATATVMSWSFVDSLYGWMLAREVAAAAPKLYRTEDGGITWTDLGLPVAAPDQAFQVQFSHFTTGWLSTVSAGPYAYRTEDFGVTWTRVPLPGVTPPNAVGGEYFVAVRPTTGLGALATVVYFPPVEGRTGIGGIIRGYPPLTVRAFDGGRPHTYIFTTVLDQVVAGPFAEEPPPNQTELGTIDAGKSWSAIAPPAAAGAIGYSDASHWWWIGQGMFAGSTDGGASWTDPRDIGVVEPEPGSLQVLDADHAWFAGQSGTRARLEMTDDGGRHWTLTTLPPLEDRVTDGLL